MTAPTARPETAPTPPETDESEAERLAEVLSHALTDADEWVKSAEVANLVDAVLASDWLAAHVAAARADALREAADRIMGWQFESADRADVLESLLRLANELHARADRAALLAETPGSDT